MFSSARMHRAGLSGASSRARQESHPANRDGGGALEPFQVPIVRAQLAEALWDVARSGPGGPGACLRSGDDGDLRPRSEAKMLAARSRLNAGYMERAELWWVGERMTEAVRDASRLVPLSVALRAAPTPHGLLVFGAATHLHVRSAGSLEAPCAVVESREAVPGLVPVVGIAWTTHGGHVEVFVLHPHVSGASRGREIGMQSLFKIAQDGTVPRSPGAVARVLGSIWLWWGQPELLEVSVQKVRRRRNMKGVGGWPAQVRTVDLDSSLVSHDARVGMDGRRGEDGVSAGWAMQGYWRQRAHGPQLSQRSVTWVAPVRTFVPHDR